MIERYMRLSSETTHSIVEHLNTLRDRLEPDVSNYAPGRQRFWFPYEAPLSPSRSWRMGVQDERLWSWVKRQFPQIDLALAAFGDVGIDWHRDASYADFPAYSVNLGTVEAWLYDDIYPGYAWAKPQDCNPSHPVRIAIEPGDVLKFNCKNPHSVLNPAPDRWSLNLWTVAPKARSRFLQFLEQAQS